LVCGTNAECEQEGKYCAPSQRSHGWAPEKRHKTSCESTIRQRVERRVERRVLKDGLGQRGRSRGQ
jgi:hypothetical protein